MAMNRVADRWYDARNPRTARRELVTGEVSPRAAWTLLAVSAGVFVATATLISEPCGWLSLLVAFAVYASIQSRINEKSARSEANAKTEALKALKAAKEERTRADQTAERLRDELTTSTVERGRLLGLAGNMAAAEALLWPAFLRDPSSRQTHWALWELYCHQPCLATVAAHEGSVNGLVISPDEKVMYSCFTCHIAVEGRDYIFTRYAP